MTAAYSARVIEKHDNGKGYWDTFTIGVYRDEELVGNYHRGYSLLDTFFPFTMRGRDLALYSPKYTATRILGLPECVDLGGEEPSSGGFCPVHFYVPEQIAYQEARTDFFFGFVAGCVWGDDTSWKIQFLDLSKAQEGIIKRDDRFGYIELPAKVKLEDAVSTFMYDEWCDEPDQWSPRIEIAVSTSFDVFTGKPV